MARSILAELPLATEILVRPVKNRGRDVMPWLCAFRDEILRHDLMLHIPAWASSFLRISV